MSEFVSNSPKNTCTQDIQVHLCLVSIAQKKKLSITLFSSMGVDLLNLLDVVFCNRNSLCGLLRKVERDLLESDEMSLDFVSLEFF